MGFVNDKRDMDRNRIIHALIIVNKKIDDAISSGDDINLTKFLLELAGINDGSIDLYAYTRPNPPGTMSRRR